MSGELIRSCRALLSDVTPLRSDCGQICQHACCESLPGEQTGMLLFPGEAALYADLPQYRILPAGDRQLIICPGRCSRSDRPLSCRLFPLLPVLREDGVHVAKDVRATAICPLHREAIRSLRPEFIDAVKHVGELLLQEPDTKAFLLRLTAENDELKALQKRFR